MWLKDWSHWRRSPQLLGGREDKRWISNYVIFLGEGFKFKCSLHLTLSPTRGWNYPSKTNIPNYCVFYLGNDPFSINIWLWLYLGYLIFSKKKSFQNVTQQDLTLSISGYLTSRKDGGARSEGIFIIFSNWDLVLDVKDQNPKAQPSTFKIVALRVFWNIDIFSKNKKKMKIRYITIRIFIQKKVCQIQTETLRMLWFFFAKKSINFNMC